MRYSHFEVDRGQIQQRLCAIEVHLLQKCNILLGKLEWTVSEQQYWSDCLSIKFMNARPLYDCMWWAQAALCMQTIKLRIVQGESLLFSVFYDQPGLFTHLPVLIKYWGETLATRLNNFYNQYISGLVEQVGLVLLVVFLPGTSESSVDYAMCRGLCVSFWR